MKALPRQLSSLSDFALPPRQAPTFPHKFFLLLFSLLSPFPPTSGPPVHRMLGNSYAQSTSVFLSTSPASLNRLGRS